MNTQDHNPYEAPTSFAEQKPTSGGQTELASRLSRLGARIVDIIISLVISIPVMFSTGYLQRAAQQQVGIGEMAMYGAGGFVAFLLLHGYFLATRGQTIGKMLVGVRIVDYDTGQLLSLVKLVGLRDLPIAIVAMIPCIGGIVALVDILMIFGNEQRCLHDLIARTKVVNA
jgi:uncharacterized RDD family membrane protein YckC